MTIKFLRRMVLATAASALLFSAPFAAAQSDQEFRIVQAFEIKNFEPKANGWRFRTIGITESLVVSDQQGNIIPGIAESWTTSADGKDWTFSLRKGVTFHNGTPVTAEAVKASFEKLTPTSEFFSKAPIEGIEADGDKVIFRLSEPFGSFLSYIIDPSVGVLAPESFDADGKVVNLISIGPYKIADMELPRSIDLVRHQGYWGEVGKIEAIRLDSVSNPETRANIAAAGDADLVLEIPSTSAKKVDAAGSMHIVSAPLPRVMMLMLNAAKPQFSDVNVRHALSLAIDRAGIGAVAMGDAKLAANQYIPPSSEGWYFPDFPPLRYNVDEAKQILDKAGWVPGTDGIRLKDGVRFEGLLLTFPQRAYLPVTAEALQAQFKEIGFDLKISVGESSLIPEGQRDGSLELALGIRTMVYQVPDPISTLEIDFASDEVPVGATGSTGWKSEKLRQAVQDYQSTTDEAKRQPLRRVIADILHQELPVIPITFSDEKWAISNRVEGFVVDPVLQSWSLNKLSLKD